MHPVVAFCHNEGLVVKKEQRKCMGRAVCNGMFCEVFLGGIPGSTIWIYFHDQVAANIN